MSQFSRRKFLAHSAVGSLACCVWPRAASAQGYDPERSAVDMINKPAQDAIERGLAYLATRQHDDGSIGSGGYRQNVAVGALTGMAFMSAGSTPGRGPYGEHLQKCVDHMLQNVGDRGFVVVSDSASHGPMYGHGFATLFLAEVYGMTMRGDIREKLAKAVDLILQTQNEDGGWRYQPQRKDADLSVTICQVMALRAARNAGLYVPNATIDRCIDYVKRSQNADGGFMYMVQGGQSAFPRSAAGVVALYSAGIYEGEAIEKGLKYLMRHLPRGGYSRQSHYYYGHYYAVQAMWHAGDDYWKQWYPRIRDELISRQREDGAWMDAICPEYGTAMACVILQMPNNYLPIFQR